MALITDIWLSARCARSISHVVTRKPVVYYVNSYFYQLSAILVIITLSAMG